MDLKEFYAIAKEQLEELSPLDHADFRLEQAEYNKKEKAWEIVVSYLVENTNKLSKSLFPFERIYKKLKINDTKEVIGYYIYNDKE